VGFIQSPLPETPVELFVVIESVRNQNIGTTLRYAVAFGASALIIVGSDKISTHGAHGAQHHLKILHFFYWNECKEFLRSKNCLIRAIVPSSEISRFDNVYDSRKFSYSGSSAFILASKSILSNEQVQICDDFLTVYFPHEKFSRDVHYDVIVSITLQHFASSMNFIEREFFGEKFSINSRNVRGKKVQSMSSLSEFKDSRTTLSDAAEDNFSFLGCFSFTSEDFS
jgi:hypothetical protein